MAQPLATLGELHAQVHAAILSKQHPVSGLLPASTAITSHGDYTDAWVRDNVYSILPAWALGLAYRRVGDDAGAGYELERRTVALMRGLLRSMMHQAGKVERFKHTTDPRDALHAKYDTTTGAPVVGDTEWGHLQIDATSLYLLTLAQMTASGLDIIWTIEEVRFVQNLVYYIERAYRTPDYGIWERGAKTNRGNVELNASSLGMARAALEALAGFNLLGSRGTQASVIHVNPDSIAQTEITLESILPRESNTKETDAALLSTFGFPAYAVRDRGRAAELTQGLVRKLEGRYGLKRFLRDGHQTVLEDPDRLHYEDAELKQFENVESEWPLFFSYLYVDAAMRGDREVAARYRQALERVAVVRGGQRLLPELYYVPLHKVDAERAHPHSQTRVPNDNVPLVWAQSLYLLGQMLDSELLRPGDIDPLGRRHLHSPAHPVVQVALVSEDEGLKAELLSYGVPTETPADLQPVLVVLPEDIADVYSQVGTSPRLGLTGRPKRLHKTLSTSRIFHLGGEMVVCLAPLSLPQQSHLALDPDFVVNRFETELLYLHRHWTLPGRPTLTLLLTRSFLAADRSSLLGLVRRMQDGRVGSVPVRTGRLHELSRLACVEKVGDIRGVALPRVPLLERLHARHVLAEPGSQAPLTRSTEQALEEAREHEPLVHRLAETTNLYEQIELLAAIKRLLPSLDSEVTLRGARQPLRRLLEEVYEQAGHLRLWALVRRAAGLLDKVDSDLYLAVTAILVRQKSIQVGKAYSDASHIARPLPESELLARIATYCRDDARDRVLTQEILLYLSLLIQARPELFAGLSTLRISHLILLLVGKLQREQSLKDDQAYDGVMNLPPSKILENLEHILSRYHALESLPQQLEQLRARTTDHLSEWHQDLGLEMLPTPEEGWLHWRRHAGVVDRRPDGFYVELWDVFRHTEGLVIGDKMDRRNRLASSIVLSDMTPGEKSFALAIEHLLNKLPAPEYRQVNVECLRTLASIFKQNPTLDIDGTLILDAIIGHAVRLCYLQHHPAHADRYQDHKAEAWREFYLMDPQSLSRGLVAALEHLLALGADEPGQDKPESEHPLELDDAGMPEPATQPTGQSGAPRVHA